MNQTEGSIMEEEEYLSLERVAEIVGYKISTVRQWINDERLPAIKLGKEWRVARSDLRAFIAQYKAKEGGSQ